MNRASPQFRSSRWFGEFNWNQDTATTFSPMAGISGIVIRSWYPTPKMPTGIVVVYITSVDFKVWRTAPPRVIRSNSQSPVAVAPAGQVIVAIPKKLYMQIRRWADCIIYFEVSIKQESDRSRRAVMQEPKLVQGLGKAFEQMFEWSILTSMPEFECWVQVYRFFVNGLR